MEVEVIKSYSDYYFQAMTNLTENGIDYRSKALVKAEAIKKRKKLRSGHLTKAGNVFLLQVNMPPDRTDSRPSAGGARDALCRSLLL